MRPNISGSLRRIALGVMLPTMLTSAGCYHSTMYPGYGYGTPMYGTPAPGYGGYQGQGIQTLTPGNYYAPGTAPTYNPNSLTPQADPNASGSSSGTGGQGSGGSNAPPYSPGVESDPSRPVPMYDSDAGGEGSSSTDDPNSNSPIQENNSGAGAPTTMSKPAPSADWAGGSGVEPASANETQEAALEPSVEAASELEPLEQTEEAGEEEEEPPLLAPPMLEEPALVKP